MLRVLIVEDDASVRALLRLMLEKAGLEIVEAAEGAEGLRACRQLRPDAVLTDLFMPGVDGLELIRNVKRECPGVGVVAISGGGFGGTMDLLPAARVLGAVEVLRKPFDRATAVAAIQRAVEAASRARLAPSLE
jgi:CheY-like chemotaxis protein